MEFDEGICIPYIGDDCTDNFGVSAGRAWHTLCEAVQDAGRINHRTDHIMSHSTSAHLLTVNIPEIGCVSIRVPGRDRIPLPKHPCNVFAPVTVRHDQESIQVTVTFRGQNAGWSVGEQHFDDGEESPPIPLSPGHNSIRCRIAGVPAGMQQEIVVEIFHAYPQPFWVKVADTVAWTPRDTAGEVIFRGRMWIVGGYTPTIANDVWSSSDGVHWQHEGDIPSESGIDIPVALVFGDGMWVTDIDGNLFNSSDGKQWQLVTNQAPWRGRRDAGGAVFRGKMWVMGGMQSGTLLNDIWSSSDGIHWQLESAAAQWSPRQIHHSLLEMDGRLWLLGGAITTTEYYPFGALNDVWSSADGVHWEKVLDHAPWPSRIWGSAAVYRDRLWIMGGFRSEPVWENFGDTWYSADGVNWYSFNPHPAVSHGGFGNAGYESADSVWAPRHESSVYAFDDSLWVAGGMVWPLKNDVWRLYIPGLCFVTQPVVRVRRLGFYEYNARADFHSGKGALTYSLKQAPDWLRIDHASGEICGHVPGVCGMHPVTLEASAPDGESVTQSFHVHVV